MKKPNLPFLLIPALLLVSVLPLFGEERGGEPAWLLYQQGLEEFRKGEYGSAVKIVKKLIETYGEIPEAQLLQAQVYEQEGEYLLAEKFYNRAYEQRKQLYILEEKYTILYRLAEIYKIQKRYRDYENLLLEILKDHDIFANPKFSRLRDMYVRTLTDDGFDRLVSLYRLKADFSLKAHADLGILYCRTGRSYQAILHLLLAELATISTVVDELKQHDPEFNYQNLGDTLALAKKREYLADYLKENDFDRNLYFLAASLFAHGVPSEAKALWKITVEIGSSEWKNRSKNQLAKPRPEPLIAY